MKKKLLWKPIVIVLIVSLLVITSSYSLLRGRSSGSGNLSLAKWNFTLTEDDDVDLLTVVPVTGDADYTFSVSSASEVDVRYTIVVSNLPDGVKVSLDGETPLPQDDNHTVSFTDIGTILYTDSVKTKTHTLTFSAVANTIPVNAQEINIDVIANQIL